MAHFILLTGKNIATLLIIASHYYHLVLCGDKDIHYAL